MKSLRSIAAYLVRTPLHPQWLLGPRRLLPGMDSASGMLLDIGAADRWIERLLPQGAHYIALDYPATGKDIYEARPDVFADGARLPFADCSLDCVVCLEVIEHVTDPALVVGEIARVLRVGGRAWLSMPFLYPVHDAPHDYQRFTVHGLRRDIGRAGLEVVSIRQCGHAIRTAGLLASVAVAGGVYGRTGAARLLLPIAASLVLLINTAAFAVSLVWPDWDGSCILHEVEVRKT